MEPMLREYIEDLLAAVENVSAPSRAVIQNIMEDPIPKNVKQRLIRPMLPRPVPQERNRKLQKRKAILEEFDPIVIKNARGGGPPQFALNKEVECLHLTEYRVVVPDNNSLKGDNNNNSNGDLI